MVKSPSEIPNTGLLFFFAAWSESRLYLEKLIDFLNDYPQISLFVYDIDTPEFRRLSNKFQLVSHGKGEFLIRLDGKNLGAFIGQDLADPSRFLHLLQEINDGSSH